MADRIYELKMTTNLMTSHGEAVGKAAIWSEDFDAGTIDLKGLLDEAREAVKKGGGAAFRADAEITLRLEYYLRRE